MGVITIALGVIAAVTIIAFALANGACSALVGLKKALNWRLGRAWERRRRLLSPAAALVLLLILSVPIASAIPMNFPLQGRITTTAGVPVSGNVAIEFRIYNAPSGGSLLYDTGVVFVQADTSGRYNYTLTVTNLTFDVPYYLGVLTNGEAESNRIAFGSVGYSYRSNTTDSLNPANGYNATKMNLSQLFLGPGTSSAAPFIFAPGANLSTPQQGAMEFDGSALYFTPVSSRERVAVVSDLESKAGTGNCPAGFVVQNVTSEGPQCTSAPSGNYSGSEADPVFIVANSSYLIGSYNTSWLFSIANNGTLQAQAVAQAWSNAANGTLALQSDLSALIGNVTTSGISWATATNGTLALQADLSALIGNVTTSGISWDTANNGTIALAGFTLANNGTLAGQNFLNANNGTIALAGFALANNGTLAGQAFQNAMNGSLAKQADLSALIGNVTTSGISWDTANNGTIALQGFTLANNGTIQGQAVAQAWTNSANGSLAKQSDLSALIGNVSTSGISWDTANNGTIALAGFTLANNGTILAQAWANAANGTLAPQTTLSSVIGNKTTWAEATNGTLALQADLSAVIGNSTGISWATASNGTIALQGFTLANNGTRPCWIRAGKQRHYLSASLGQCSKRNASQTSRPISSNRQL
jgi:hypothetical protein